MVYKAPKKYGQYDPSSYFEAITLPALPVSDVLKWGENLSGRRLSPLFKTYLPAGSSCLIGDPEDLAAGVRSGAVLEFLFLYRTLQNSSFTELCRSVRVYPEPQAKQPPAGSKYKGHPDTPRGRDEEPLSIRRNTSRNTSRNIRRN